MSESAARASVQRFPLAPMSGLILWLTVILLPLPLLLLWAGSRGGLGSMAWAPATFVAVIYLFIWLYMRPSHFAVSRSSLDIVWPLRRFSVPRAEIESAELLSGPEFRSRFGYGLRIGAGGLWGGFGLLKTRNVTFHFYISSLDEYVVIGLRSGPPLLITPADPRRFVRALAMP